MLWQSQPQPQRENKNLKLQSKRQKMSNRHEFANCIDIVYEILTNVQKCTALLLLMLLFKLAILVKKIHFRGVRGGLLWAILAQNMPPGLVDTGKKQNLLPHEKLSCGSNFGEPDFLLKPRAEIQGAQQQ